MKLVVWTFKKHDFTSRYFFYFLHQILENNFEFAYAKIIFGKIKTLDFTM